MPEGLVLDDIAKEMVPNKPFSLACKIEMKSRGAKIQIRLQFGTNGEAYSISGFPRRLSPDAGRQGRHGLQQARQAPLRSPSDSPAPKHADTAADWVEPSDPQGDLVNQISLSKYSDPTQTFRKNIYEANPKGILYFLRGRRRMDVPMRRELQKGSTSNDISPSSDTD